MGHKKFLVEIKKKKDKILTLRLIARFILRAGITSTKFVGSPTSIRWNMCWSEQSNHALTYWKTTTTRNDTSLQLCFYSHQCSKNCAICAMKHTVLIMHTTINSIKTFQPDLRLMTNQNLDHLDMVHSLIRGGVSSVHTKKYIKAKNKSFFALWQKQRIQLNIKHRID